MEKLLTLWYVSCVILNAQPANRPQRTALPAFHRPICLVILVSMFAQMAILSIKVITLV